jgi:hypothetical protein
VSGIEMALMALPFAFMVQTIEVRNKYGGAWDECIQMETETPMAGLVCCPRETVKFFHRRNSCDCLQEIYYKLKERTKRVWVCAACQQVKDKKEIFECSCCKLITYCSRDCAVAHWPNHKEECKHWADIRESRKST